MMWIGIINREDNGYDNRPHLFENLETAMRACEEFAGEPLEWNDLGDCMNATWGEWFQSDDDMELGGWEATLYPIENFDHRF